MNGWLAKQGRGFIAADDETARVHARMSDGECARVKLIRPRSVQWNRMYFGICRAIGNNQDPPRTEDSIDHELRIRAGHFDVFKVDGHDYGMAKRIAFDQMTADEWSELWPSLEQAIREHFGEEYIGESQRTGSW